MTSVLRGGLQGPERIKLRRGCRDGSAGVIVDGHQNEKGARGFGLIRFAKHPQFDPDRAVSKCLDPKSDLQAVRMGDLAESRPIPSKVMFIASSKSAIYVALYRCPNWSLSFQRVCIGWNMA